MTATPLVILLALLSVTAGEDDSSHCSTGDIFPHESSCAKYYYCNHEGSKEEIQCSRGMLFNTEKKMCDEAQNVKCAIESSEELVQKGLPDDGESNDDSLLNVKSESTQTGVHLVHVGISEPLFIIPEDYILKHPDFASKIQMTNLKLGVYKGKDIEPHRNWHDSSHFMNKREAKVYPDEETAAEIRSTDEVDVTTDVYSEDNVHSKPTLEENAKSENDKGTKTTDLKFPDDDSIVEKHDSPLLIDITKYLEMFNRQVFGDSNTTSNDTNSGLVVRFKPVVDVQHKTKTENQESLKSPLLSGAVDHKAQEEVKNDHRESKNDEKHLETHELAKTPLLAGAVDHKSQEEGKSDDRNNDDKRTETLDLGKIDYKIEGMETRRKRNIRRRRAVRVTSV